MASIRRLPTLRQAKKAPIIPKFFTIPAGSILWRIYRPEPHKVGPTSFRRFGPCLRFDHHPGQGKGKKRTAEFHLTRGIFYAAPDFEVCVTECFGAKREIDPTGCMVAEIHVTHDLVLIDLVNRAMAAGTIAAIGQVEHHYKAQEWSRLMYDMPGCEHVHGIYYRSAYINGLSVALYERAEGRVVCPAGKAVPLDDPVWRSGLLSVADKHGMTLV